MSWPVVEFGEVATIVTGSTPKKVEGNYDGDVPFVTPGDLGIHAEITHSNSTITEKGAKSGRLLPKGAVLVCCIGATIGKVGIAARHLITNQQINSLVFDESKVFPKFGYYFCTSIKPLLIARSSSTTMPIVNKSNFSKFEMPLPPLDEQKRIAAILDKADSVRRKRQKAIDLADDFLRSVFIDMFGDPVTNPRGWEVKNLGDCLDFLTSGSRGWAKYYSEEGRKFIRIMNVGKNRLILNDIAYVNPPETKEAERTRVKVGDVMLSITADLGRSAVVTKDLEGGHINQHLALLRPNTQIINSTYLSALLSSNSALTQFASANKSAVKAGLNFTDIREFKVLAPPIRLQVDYEQLTHKLTASINKLNSSFEYQTSLFNSLSLKAFAGEL